MFLDLPFQFPLVYARLDVIKWVIQDFCLEDFWEGIKGMVFLISRYLVESDHVIQSISSNLYVIQSISSNLCCTEYLQYTM